MARPSMQGEILHPPNLLLPFREPQERGRHQVVEREATVIFLDTFARKIYTRCSCCHFASFSPFWPFIISKQNLT